MEINRSKDNFIRFDKQNVLCAAIAIVLTLVMLVLCLRTPAGKEKYDIVLMGDSVVANMPVYLGKSTQGYLQEQTGKAVFNGAFSGSSMANREFESLSYCLSEWSMANLAESICERDFASAKAAMSFAYYYKLSNKQVFDGYDDKMETLSQIDFSKVEVLVIEHGTNDYNSGVKIDNEADAYDTDTFGGALRTSLRMFQETYPNLRIILVTPLYCEVGSDERFPADVKDWGGGYLYQYVEKEKEIADQFGIELIDMYHESGVNAETIEQYTVDGLHLTEAGIVLWGDMIADYLKGHAYEN